MTKKEFVKSDYIKIEILKALKQGKGVTYYTLTKITQINWNSLKPNCRFLEKLGYLTITPQETPGMKYEIVEITREGRNALNRF